jgi:hypothetical protein
MSAPFAPPSLTLPTFDAPARLVQTLGWLGGEDGSAAGTFNSGKGGRSGGLPMRHDADADAQSWLAAVADGGKHPPAQNPRLLRALVKAYPDQTDPFLRDAILQAVLRGSQRVTWRSLWLLWEHVDAAQDRDAIIPVLVEHLQAALLRRPHRRADLPGWLGIDDPSAARRGLPAHASLPPNPFEQAKRMESALHNPVPYIAGWVLRQGVPMDALLSHLGCATSSQMGQHVLKMLATQAPADWWTAQPLRARFAWAERCGLAVVQAVAERELYGLAARAGGPSRVHLIPERVALRDWISEQLGSPSQHPGRWAAMTRRSADVFSWLA